MRIVLLGQAAFGESVFHALLLRGDEIAGVFAPPSTPGRRPDPLVVAAQSAGVTVFQPRRLRDPEVQSQMRDLGADLGVMAFVTDIAPASLFAVPRLGTIQYHPSLLPRHRGGSAINWAVIQGETHTGLSIFWPDGGIDTGPILIQKETEIGPDDTTGSLYFEKLFPLGVQAITEAVTLVEQNKALKIAQDESLATYEPLCTPGRCQVDWRQSQSVVHNLIRGSDPQPGASSTFRNSPIRFFSASRLVNSALVGAPGDILSIEPNGIVVGTASAPVLLGRVQPARGAKMAGVEWAETVAVQPGERFGA